MAATEEQTHVPWAFYYLDEHSRQLGMVALYDSRGGLPGCGKSRMIEDIGIIVIAKHGNDIWEHERTGAMKRILQAYQRARRLTNGSREQVITAA